MQETLKTLKTLTDWKLLADAVKFKIDNCRIWVFQESFIIFQQVYVTDSNGLLLTA